MEEVRVDCWLCAARIFKSRTQASQACGGGHVQVNGTRAKAHRTVQAGDQLRVQTAESVRLLRVVGLAEKRLSAPLARALYEDETPVSERPTPPEDPSGVSRPRGLGRPTKRERRILRNLRGR